MNHLLVGDADKTERLLQITKPGFLLIDDGPIADAFLARFSRAKLFDPAVHSFDPLHAIDYKKARAFAAALYGEKDLMTYRDGKRALTKMLLSATTQLDNLPDVKHKGNEEAHATINDLLLSPVLNQVLCNPTNFAFKGSVVAKIDRTELWEDDAFILATLLIGQFKGQVIVPDFGFYGREFHMSLIRQNRLIAGLTGLAELAPKLQQAVLRIKDKTVYRTTREDAERLMFYIDPRGNPNTITDLDGNDYLPK